MVHGKWTFSYGQKLYFLPNYEVEMVRPDGRSIFFKKSGGQYQGVNNGFNAGTASLGELSRLPTGAYQYKRLDGVVEYFDSQGRLQKLAHRSGAEHRVVRGGGSWGSPEELTVTHSSTNQAIKIRYGTLKSRYGDGTVVANFRAQESLVDFVSPSGEKTQFGSRTQHYYMGPFAEAPETYSTGTYTVSQSIPDTIAPPSSYSGGMAPAGFHIGVHLPKLAYILWPGGDRTHFFMRLGAPVALRRRTSSTPGISGLCIPHWPAWLR